MTALEAALSRQFVPGVNATANYRTGCRLLAEMNALNVGEFVLAYEAPRGARNFSSQVDMVAVILKPAAQ